MNAAFFDELSKIAAAKRRKPVYHRTAIAAHEMGHAKDYEGSKIPRLRSFGRAAGPIAGLLGGAVLTGKGHTGLGVLAGAAGMTPMLADEAIASHTAMKELRSSGLLKEKDLKKARNQLLQAGGTYLSSAAGLVGASVALGKGQPEAAQISALAGGLGGLGLATSMVAGLEKTPKSEKKVLEKLRKQMGVNAQIYEKKKQPGEGGRWHELGAFYMPKVKSKFMQAMYEKDIGDMVKGDNKRLKRLLSEGGVVLPRAG